MIEAPLALHISADQ